VIRTHVPSVRGTWENFAPVKQEPQGVAPVGYSGGSALRQVAPIARVSAELTYTALTRKLAASTAPLLSVREVAARIGVCSATVYALCSRRELTHVRIRNAIRVYPADLVAFLARQRRGGR